MQETTRKWIIASGAFGMKTVSQWEAKLEKVQNEIDDMVKKMKSEAHSFNHITAFTAFSSQR